MQIVIVTVKKKISIQQVSTASIYKLTDPGGGEHHQSAVCNPLKLGFAADWRCLGRRRDASGAFWCN